jgi:hypothetical protein
MHRLPDYGPIRVVGLGLPLLDFLTPRLLDCTKGRNRRQEPKAKDDHLAYLTGRAKPPAEPHVTTLAYAILFVK